MSGTPYPKAQQLARGERRYRRKVASPKRWQAIIAAKRGPCRVCGLAWSETTQYHHLVSRAHGGDDVAENIVPLSVVCHAMVTQRQTETCHALMANLQDAEYAYMIERGGEHYPERSYGVRYGR